MGQFQQIVLDYLEHYEPERFEHLKQTRVLRAHLSELVDQLYSETDRAFQQLRERHPDRSHEQLRLYAERLAIAAVLPLTSEEPMSEGRRSHEW